MTISVNGNPQQYTGTGANTALNTVFFFFVASDIIVTQRVTASGVDTVLTLGTHYAVAGGSETGAVGTVTPVSGSTDFTTDMTWTLERSLPLTQVTDLVDNDSLPAESVETALDREVMLMQDTGLTTDRTLRFPTADLSSLTSEIPDSVTRALKVLSFDATGNATVSTPTTVGYGKVLLDSQEASADATIEMNAVNWPATYDRVELELINVLASSPSTLVLKPIDDGSPTTSNLSVLFREQVAGVVTDVSDSNWEFDTNAGDTTDDVVSGSAIFTNCGLFLHGHGDWTYRSGSSHVWVNASYQRHSSTATQWDGFEVSFDGGNITSGTIRLWGIPKV